jgi:MinD-like ATPase involved in chromosome partitioning or flagellar assembly
VILDCHGGLDYASVAAYESSSHTIVVTEADPVTFNGTLELLSFYDREHRPDNVVQGDEQLKPPEVITESGGSTTQKPNECKKIQFLVNRLPPKYKFFDVRATYRRLLNQYTGRLNLAREVLSFIPEETFIADSFGEYPFVVKLAPTSIIARKLQLIAFQLLGPEDSELAKYRPLKKLRSPRFRRKIERSVISAEGRNTKNIIQAFGSSVSVLTLFVAAYSMFLIWFQFKNWAFRSSSLEAYTTLSDSKPFLIIAALSAVYFIFYAVKAQFGLMYYYREAYRFRRALLRATGDHLKFWQRLMLLRLWILRASNSVMPLCLAVLVGLCVVGLVIALADSVISSR